MAAILAKVSVTQPLGVLFQALVELATKADYLGENNSNPCSCFIQTAMQIGGAEGWVKKVIGAGGGEYRLNGAGLKMYITINHTGTQCLVTFGGDQAHMYPDFVRGAKDATRALNLDHDAYWRDNG